MGIVKLTSMQGGDGAESYARNSGPQNFGFHAYAKAHLVEAIQLYKKSNAIGIRDMDKQNEDHVIQVMSPRLVRIADYGCGYGRNTVEYAQFIVSKLLELHSEEDNEFKEETALSKPEFIKELQYYFIDLPSDDFNSLFCMLHDHDFARVLEGSLKFFCAGVPQSFYNHVLPEGSVDFAITTYALHWLSQVPAALLDKNAPTWNGGHVWIPTGDGAAAAAVSEAYAKQFQEDARKFLRNRAEEMKSNGILFILSTCHAQETSTLKHVSRSDIHGGYFEQAWNELVEEGIIEASERDTFNVPYYNCSRREFEDALESVAELELLDLHALAECDHIPSSKMDGLLSHPTSFGEFWSSFIQSLNQPLVDAHIGKKQADQLFDRLQEIATENALGIKNIVCDLLIAIIRKK